MFGAVLNPDGTNQSHFFGMRRGFKERTDGIKVKLNSSWKYLIVYGLRGIQEKFVVWGMDLQRNEKKNCAWRDF
jgi:hypothetical protein